MKFTPVRVVCQNTLSLALNSGSGIKISHHTDIHQRLKAAEKMLGIVRHQFDELADTFREMVKVPMNHNRLEKYLEYVYPAPKDRESTESELECITRDRSWSEYFFDLGSASPVKRGAVPSERSQAQMMGERHDIKGLHVDSEVTRIAFEYATRSGRGPSDGGRLRP